MPLASDKVVGTGRSSVFRGGPQLLSVATILYFAISEPSWTQESIIIGSELPAIEVNEKAAYYGLSQPRILTHQLPLFDPNKHILESRILTLPPPYSVDLRATPDINGSRPQQRVEKLPVLEEGVKEVVVTSNAQNQPGTEVEDLKRQSIPLKEKPPRNAAEIDSQPSKTPETELAAIPPTQEIAPEEDISDPPIPNSGNASVIIFGKGEKEIQDKQRDKLSVLVDRMLRDKKIRLQLKSYSSDINGSASGARRLSLARALAVRSFLIEAGVNSTRIDVRALGAKNESGPADRVDLVVKN